MSDSIRLPRSALELIPSALQRGILISLLERADERGQLTISVRGFADEIGVSYQNMRTAIAKLTANAIINAAPTQASTQRLTQITICDFDTYTAPLRKQQRSGQRKANAIANAADTPVKSSKFTPPTEEEVKAYVLEKGYHFNPEQFIPHYQSKGWKVGKEPMKDWQAACRTWEASWKEKHGERFYYEIQRTTATDSAASRKERRDRGLSLATEIVARSENLLNLYNGVFADPDDSQN